MTQSQAADGAVIIPMQSQHEVVGLIPAAGGATRLSPLPCSKELYPIGLLEETNPQNARPKVVAHYLLERLGRAGICKAFIVLRSGKWDIPAYFQEGKMVNMSLAYLAVSESSSVPETLNYAYPFVQNSLVALGFPDILFEPADAYVRVLERQKTTGAEVVLGLFPTSRPEKADMVDFDDGGRIREIVIKPTHTVLRYAWTIAVWTPVFSRFLQHYVARATERAAYAPPASESFVGNVFQAALKEGMRIESTLFPEGYHLDIGTPEDLVRAVQDHFGKDR